MYRAETNTTNTRVLIKDFGTQIVKLVLEYSLKSHDLISSHDVFSIRE